MKNFNEDETKKIIDMYLETKDIEKMMDVFDCDEHDLRIVLKDNQVDRKYNSFSDELYERIIQLYKDENKKQKDICYDTVISSTCINKIVDREGIPRKGYSISNRKYSRNSHYFDIIDTPNKAYILGLLYADGCNHYDSTRPYVITLSLQESDKLILDKIKDELQYEGPVRFVNLHDKNPNYKNQYVLVINDRHMSDTLKKCGVVKAKSLTLKFPDFLPNELLRHFCRGYFDGDGNIYYYIKNNKCATQTVGTLDVCQKFSEILYEIDCRNSIKHPKQCGNNTFIVQTSGNKSSYKFLSWMYKDAELKLDRKYQQYLDFCKLYPKSHINLNQSNELIK